MIRYVYGDQIDDYPKLATTMFRDRAKQFHDRMGWDVEIDPKGEERDQYDALNPLYVIWERLDGKHGGSMRLLPTTGRTMVNEHFTDITDGVRIESPLIWECSRFCLAPDAASQVSSGLMLAGGEIMHGFGIEHFVGVFDARMVRIYRHIGAPPTIIGSSGFGRSAISIGLWEFTEQSRRNVAISAGLSTEISRHWFERAFGTRGAGLQMTA